MKFLLVFILTLSVSFLFSQEYFQQKVDFNIDVKLNDKENSLSAYEKITYTNNSPDTLYYIYFHIWPNAYKNKKTAYARQQIGILQKDFIDADKSQLGYIDSLDFRIDSKNCPWEIDKQNIDICKVFLLNPLLPGDSIIIETPFYVKLPYIFSRLGYSDDFYAITQWYPKPAVYDKDGWHEFPYLDMGEFYSEFGTFNVKITLPKKYIVAATGNLLSTEELQFYDSLAQNYPASNPFFEDNSLKIVHFSETNIHDFAWFASSEFQINKSIQILPHSKDTVTTWTFFIKEYAKQWEKAINYVNSAVFNYSKWIGDYPYKNCTAVCGNIAAGGGMEYPTITIIDPFSDDFSVEHVIVHEVGHNWWYGILGSNERKYPWIDEGINSYYDLRYVIDNYPDRKLLGSYQLFENSKAYSLFNAPFKSSYEIGYHFNARRNLDQPSNLSSEEYYAINYGLIIYQKVAFVFNYLKEYLGEEKFDSIIQDFYIKWKFKHPQPDDLFIHFKNNCNEDLKWLEDLINTNKRIDYKLCNYKFFNDSISIKVKNNGSINSPVNISLIKNDTLKYSFWSDGFEKTKTFNVKYQEFDKIKLDFEKNIPDINKRNNSIRKNGLFKKIEPLKLNFLGNYEEEDFTHLYYFTAIGFNKINGFMAGLFLYNSVAPIKKFEYRLMPMYAFKNKQLSGLGEIAYNIFPYSNFQFITLSIAGKSFGITENSNYYKIKPQIEFKFRNNYNQTTIDNRLIINYIYITNFEKTIYFDTTVYSSFLNLSYKIQDNRKINPYSLSMNLNSNKDFIKIGLETKYKLSYNNIKKGIEFRLYAGKFIYENKQYYGNYNFRTSSFSGYNDYMAEQHFFNRFDNIGNNIFSNQMTINEGGFNIYTPIGQSNDWITTLNISTSIPGKIPIMPYLNIGTYSYTWSENNFENIIYEAGIELRLIKDIVSVFFPIHLSNSLKTTSNIIYENYLQKVRFTLNLNKLNPFIYTKEYIL